MGSSIGILFLELMTAGMGISIERIGGQSFIVIGAAAMLSSYTRLTYSLAVIMLETTQSINLFLPIIVTILISNGTSKIFNRSLYEYAIRGKQMPLLRNHLPKINRKIRVKELIRD